MLVSRCHRTDTDTILDQSSEGMLGFYNNPLAAAVSGQGKGWEEGLGVSKPPANSRVFIIAKMEGNNFPIFPIIVPFYCEIGKAFLLLTLSYFCNCYCVTMPVYSSQSSSNTTLDQVKLEIYIFKLCGFYINQQHQLEW